MKQVDRQDINLPKLKFVRIDFEAPTKRSKSLKKVNKID